MKGGKMKESTLDKPDIGPKGSYYFIEEKGSIR